MLKLFLAARHMGRGLFNAVQELGSVRLAPPRDHRSAAHRLAGALGTIARAHDLEVTVCGEIPRSTALIVANHVSYLDPIALIPTCPALLVARNEVSAWPVVGPFVGELGVLFVERADPLARAATLRRIHDLLAAGAPVLNFPENTTTSGTEVGPFWRGSFGIAQRLAVPVVPVAIHYRDPATAWSDGATFLPHYLRMAARPRIEVALSFGAPMHPRAEEAPEAMAARARGIISHMLDKMRLPR
jgi:1-acyl-sn-glycerol-3-phosphate acyltransferase